MEELYQTLRGLNQKTKKLRSDLHDASTAKASELIQLRDNLSKLRADRDKSTSQYSALFKKHQRTLDSLQLVQTEKERLQEQIREIQRLSGGQMNPSIKSSSVSPVNQQILPDQNIAGSSVKPVIVDQQVVEEPAQNSSSASEAEAGINIVDGQAPPPVVADSYQDSARLAIYPDQAIGQDAPQIYKRQQAFFNKPNVIHAPVYYQGQDNINWYPGGQYNGGVRKILPVDKKNIGRQGINAHENWQNMSRQRGI